MELIQKNTKLIFKCSKSENGVYFGFNILLSIMIAYSELLSLVNHH